jgi:hypothetical protein
MVLPMHYHGRRRKKINLLGNLCERTKGKPLLPLLTIITVQYDTHMIFPVDYLRGVEFANQFQTPKASYTLRALISSVVVSASRAVPYAASCCMITTTRWLPVIEELPRRSRFCRPTITGAHWIRTYATTSVSVTHISRQSLIGDAAPASSPRMRHPGRSDPKCFQV